VEETIETVEIDEGAEFGEIFDAAFDFGTLVEMREELGALFVALFFNQFAAGEDDVFTVLVEFDDAALESLAHELAEVLWGVDVDLGGRKEGLHADIDGQAAFDDAFDHAFDGFASLTEFDDLVPVLFLGGFLAGKNDQAVLVFQALEQDLNLVTDGQIVRRAEFAQIDGAFGFVADVDHDFTGATFDNASFDDGSLTEILHRLRQKSFEIGHMDGFLGLSCGPMNRPDFQGGAGTAERVR